MAKLFKITLSSKLEHLPSLWVIAKDPTEAEIIVKTALDNADYGFSKERVPVTIELIADDYLYSPCGVLFQKDVIVRGLEPKKQLA